MYSLESPHRGDSNENSKYTIFNMKKKNTLNYPRSAAVEFFSKGLKKRVRNSRGKQAISVRAIEVLLYIIGLTHLVRSSSTCYMIVPLLAGKAC